MAAGSGGPATPARRWLLLLPAALVAVLLLSGLWALQQWRAPTPPDAPAIEVEIPRGASLARAAALLEDAGAVSDARLFRLMTRLFGGGRAIQHGVYEVRPGEGWGAILARMQRGDTLTVRVTIPEGMPSIMVAERLNAMERLEGMVETPAEGSILPATYEAKVGESRAAVMARMQKAMDAELDRLWERRTARAVVKTKEEAVILASIVEKESGLASERRRIAGLYTNRLRAGMRLEADPTVIYPVTRGKPLGRRIRLSELRADNGYNSYRRAGLPIGPIANPGRESLAAVLDPEPNDYLFMVADGSGGHAFARTYAEHQANVARWRAFRAEKGI